MWWGKVTLFLSAKRATSSWISLWSWQPKDVGVSLLLTTIIASLVHSQMEISGDHWTPTVRTYFIFKWARCAIGIHTCTCLESINQSGCLSQLKLLWQLSWSALGFVNVHVHHQHGIIVQFLVTMNSVHSEHGSEVSLDPNAMNIKFPLYLWCLYSCREPRSVSANAMAVGAMLKMEAPPSPVTFLPVVDFDKVVIGLITLHDLVSAGL